MKSVLLGHVDVMIETCTLLSLVFNGESIEAHIFSAFDTIATCNGIAH